MTFPQLLFIIGNVTSYLKKPVNMNLTRLLFVVILTAGIFAAGGGSASAQTEGSILFISPHRVDISPTGRIEELNVANKSDVPRRYDLQVINQVMTESGTTERRQCLRQPPPGVQPDLVEHTADVNPATDSGVGTA